MSSTALANEEVKTELENSVSWYLADKLGDPSTIIAAKKYITSNNLLIYLTRCNVVESAVPRIKVQVLKRVDGGVHETGYLLYGDHRFERYENSMIFGRKAKSGVAESKPKPVTLSDAKELLHLLAALQTARQTL